MDVRAGLAMAALACSSAALAAVDPRHLIDDRGTISAMTVKTPYTCSDFFCPFTKVQVRTEDWTDMTGSVHKDGCTARWDYSGIDVDGMSMLRWRLDPGDKETYYFDAAEGVKLDPDDHNDRGRDLDQEGYFTGNDTFKWFDFNRRRRSIHFDYRIFRARGAGGAAGPELCGSFDPVIFNRG